MKQLTSLAFLGLLTAGCFSRPDPVTMAPPVAPPPVASAQGGQTWDWKDVPKNEKIPINRGVFDQGGYQLYAKSGETIVVPFENQNMYVMKFGQTSGESYFQVEENAPTLYLREGEALENAAAQGAKWYPFSQTHRYERPAYVGIAPSWGEFVAMGWYAGMVYHGGYWGYRPWYPGFYGYSPMMGLNINIGGRGYDWGGYRSYYRTNTVNRYSMRSTYNYNSVGRRAPTTFGRSSGSSGSFGRRTGSSGGFGRSSGGSFGRSSGSSGSFGRRSGGSFGSNPSGYSQRSSGGSFGRSSSGGSFGRSSGGGFGRRR
jgi:hypothetical protein